MKFFLTGASGFLGGRLSRTLLEQGACIVALTRHPRHDSGALHWVRGSYEDLDAWQEAVDGCDVVINLAGEPIAQRWTRRSMIAMTHSRIGTTAALYHAMAHAKRKPELFVSASGVHYYGTDPDSVFCEESPEGFGFLARLCREWEKAAMRAETLAIRTVRLRMGIVLERQAGALPRMAAPVRLYMGGALGHGRQVISWIHVRDLVRMITWCVKEKRVAGPLNAVAPLAVTQREFVRTLGRVLRRPVWLETPAFALRLGLGSMANEMLLAGQRVKPLKAAELGFEFHFPDHASALTDLLAEVSKDAETQP